MLNASQVTNPSIDPLREPMELKTYLGAKPERLTFSKNGNGDQVSLKTELAPQLELEIPIMFSAMSYGSISFNACQSLARAARASGTIQHRRGVLHPELYQYGSNTIARCLGAGVPLDYLMRRGAGDQDRPGAKPGIGATFPTKRDARISRTRMIPEGTAPSRLRAHASIPSKIAPLIYALKEATHYENPSRSRCGGAQHRAHRQRHRARRGRYRAIDGLRGRHGRAPTMILINVGIPIELALAAWISALCRGHPPSRLAGGGRHVRNSATIDKAIALGADAVNCHFRNSGVAPPVPELLFGQVQRASPPQEPYLTKPPEPQQW